MSKLCVSPRLLSGVLHKTVCLVLKLILDITTTMPWVTAQHHYLHYLNLHTNV